VFFVNCGEQLMEAVDILGGSIPVRHDNDIIQIAVLISELAAVSFAPHPEVDVSVKVDTNRFLNMHLLRRSVHEDVVGSNVVSRTPSHSLVQKKDKKVHKKFKY
jgi:hypothetical protein